MKSIIAAVITATVVLIIILCLYSMIGTCGNVDKIKEMVPQAFEERNWKIMRYEGFEYGSWNTNGGKVWYHVCNIDNPSIQYRVFVTMWGDELQFYYNAPETLSRIDVAVKK